MGPYLQANANICCPSEFDPPLSEDEGAEDHSDDEASPIQPSVSKKKTSIWGGTAVIIRG
jgi:hypothetical protein